MIQFNFMIIALAALVPLAIGFFWYGKMGFGNAWMKTTGLTEEKLKGTNMAVLFGLTYLFSFFIALVLNPIVIHQFGFQSMMMEEPGFVTASGEAFNDFTAILNKYPDRFRTFKHGMLHGFILNLLFALPVIGINALFERKSWKYIWLHVGYWAICLTLMGGIICQWT